MEVISQKEIDYIVQKYSFNDVINWNVENYSSKVIGDLGQHLKLVITVEKDSAEYTLYFFVKCLPKADKWKTNWLRELNFFGKEHVMLDKLFREFDEGGCQWRPRLLLAKEEVFVFEDVAELGYIMHHNEETFDYTQVIALTKTLAHFHSQSFIFEDKKSKKLGRPYRIFDEYKEYLQEPKQTMKWRNTGRNGVIDFLKVYSKYKEDPKFVINVNKIIYRLYDQSVKLMEPNLKYPNVVIHRDLWTNNILFKRDKDNLHAIIVDFQTVLYCPPMMDFSCAIYMNTTKDFRAKYLGDVIDVYYTVLTNNLKANGININSVYKKDKLIQSYEDTLTFGMTQAALILPISTMTTKDREELLCKPETSERVNVISRSQEFIDVAKRDTKYRNRILELFDEIVERYVLTA